MGYANQDQLRVFSLRGLITAPADQPDSMVMNVDTVLTAIDTGLGVSEERKATIRFHKDSGLIFVRGTNMQVELVRGILGQLENDVQSHRASQMRAKQMKAARQVGGPADGRK